jgi:hypothetical protein
LLPLKRYAGYPVSLVTINEWTTYANKKAMLANAGVAGGVYKVWKPFPPKEVQQYLVLYIFQGLSPSPQKKMKFVPQKKDPTNGSDICFKIFGRNGDRWHKMFKAFFSCQDPFFLEHAATKTLRQQGLLSTPCPSLIHVQLAQECAPCLWNG